MTKDQLLEIAQRHAEDHKYKPSQHPRPATWPQDAVGDRGALLEFLADIAQEQTIVNGPVQSALKSLRPALKTPGLPQLQAPSFPDLCTRKVKE